MNIRRILQKSTEAFPDKTLIIFKDAEITYREFSGQVDRLANSFRNIGIKPNEKVGLLMFNSVEYLVSYFAIATVGAVAVPLNSALTSHEMAYQLSDSDVVAIISDESLIDKVKVAQQSVPHLRHIISTKSGKDLNISSLISTGSDETLVDDKLPADVMHLIYTSGTTGLPKGAMITHGNITWMVNRLNTFYSEEHGDSFISALPLFHAYGKLQCFLAPINAGATIIIVERFDPVGVMQIISKYKATVFFGVPTMYNLIVNSEEVKNYDLKSLRVCVSGGASLPVEILKSFKEKTGVPIAEGYGLSEVTVLTHCNPIAGLQKPGSIGPVIPGIEAKIVRENSIELALPGEVGELVVKGPNVMTGYYKKEEETRKFMVGGWLHTGDLSRVDEDGYYYIVDRIKDMYIWGGRNVYPREIEEVLFAHSKVNEAAVVGIPDSTYGEAGRAFIVLRQGMNATEGEIMEYLKERVAKYKLPKNICFVDELPKNSVGKILKRELRDLYVDEVS